MLLVAAPAGSMMACPMSWALQPSVRDPNVVLVTEVSESWLFTSPCAGVCPVAQSVQVTCVPVSSEHKGLR